MLVATSRSGATPIVPMKGVIGQADLVVKLHRAVTHGAAWPWVVFENLGCVLVGEFRPPGGFTERTALGANGHPRVITHLNILDVDQ